MFDFNKLDEPVKVLINRIEENRESDPRNALADSKELELMAVSTNNAKLHAYAYFCQAYCYYLLNEVNNSLLLCSKSVKELIETDQHELAARIYSILGIINSNIGNIPMAMDYYLQGLTLCRQYGLLKDEIVIDSNIGMLYLGFDDNTGAFMHFNSAVQNVENIIAAEGKCEEYLSDIQVSTIYLNLASCCCRTKKFEEAQRNLDIATRFAKGEYDDSLMLGILMIQARISYEEGETQRFESCLKQINESGNKLRALLNLFDDVIEYCSFLLSIERENEFWNLIHRLEDMVKPMNIPFMYRKIVELKINCYKKNNENREYLMATSLYYELSMKMEEERQKGYQQTLSVRLKLEEEKKKRKEVEVEAASLRVCSEVDALTGLRNRFKIISLLEGVFEQCSKEKKPMAVEILDVDYFKQYNDNYGHQQGDEMLQQISKALKFMERHRGVYTGRYGGDEFIIVYADRTKEEVEGFTDELKAIVEEKKMPHEYSLNSDIVTLSQGVYAGIPNSTDTMRDFIEKADQSLYKVKKAGRNNYFIAYEEE